MYDDIISTILAAEESVIRMQLGISDFDEFEAISQLSAMESVAYDMSFGYSACESTYDRCDSSWVRALEAEGEEASSDQPKKESIFKRIGEAIKGLFSKIGEIFSKAGEHIKKFISSIKEKLSKIGSNRKPKDGEYLDQRLRRASKDYMDALTNLTESAWKPVKSASEIVNKFRSILVSRSGDTNFEYKGFDDAYDKCNNEWEDANKRIDEAKDAKTNFQEAIRPYKERGKDYLGIVDYLGQQNLSYLVPMMNKAADKCKENKDFCDAFKKVYENYQRSFGGSGYIQETEIYKTKANLQGNQSETQLYNAAKLYLKTAGLVSNATGIVTNGMALLSGNSSFEDMGHNA